MSTHHNITQADLDALRINNHQPRVFKTPQNRAEVDELLAQAIEVTNVASLAAARRDLNTLITNILGTTRRGVKLPQGHLILSTTDGVRITRWEEDQRNRVKLGGTYNLSIRADVRQGVATAWEAQQ